MHICTIGSSMYCNHSLDFKISMRFYTQSVQMHDALIRNSRLDRTFSGHNFKMSGQNGRLRYRQIVWMSGQIYINQTSCQV